MKICENCGMEYGDDNPFCPFCDERYGVVFVVNDVISADGLPPYKEEFPVIGETGVQQESFAENRDKIYKRNIRLAARENFLHKREVRTVYKPVVPLAEIGRGGAIAPYKPPNPIVEKFNNIRKKIKAVNLSKTGKTALSVLSVAAVFFTVIGFSWFETTDTYADYQQAKRGKKSEKFYAEQLAEHIENVMQNYDSCIYGKNNAVMYLDADDSKYNYFAYMNKTDKDISPADFSKLFSGAEGMENFKSIEIIYSFNEWNKTEIYDGFFDFENDDKKEHLIKSGKAVSGYLIEKKNVPEEITIAGENGLELKLTNCRESSAADNIFRYDFEFQNTSDEDLLYFWSEFAGAEYTDRIYNFIVRYPNGKSALVSWSDGRCSGFHYYGIDEHGEVAYVPPYVYSGHTVTGFIELDFRED